MKSSEIRYPDIVNLLLLQLCKFISKPYIVNLLLLQLCKFISKPYMFPFNSNVNTLRHNTL